MKAPSHRGPRSRSAGLPGGGAPASRRPRRPSSRRGLLGVALALLASACLSPTLPLPPPSPPDVEPVGQGQYALEGSIPEPGHVLALNARTELLYGQVTDHRYRFLVAAEPGDVMLVWYEVDLETSSPIRVRIPEAETPDGGVPPPDAN